MKKAIRIDAGEEIFQLEAKHKNDLAKLVNLVQPGYFKKKTSELGDYYGIYNGDMLVAVAGERMKMKAYTEVSAVVTHPDHVKKGYASKLIAHVSNKIFLQNKIPYLHVAASNTAAIALYEKLC